MSKKGKAVRKVELSKVKVERHKTRLDEERSEACPIFERTVHFSPSVMPDSLRPHRECMSRGRRETLSIKSGKVFPGNPPVDFPRCLFGPKSVTCLLLNQILARKTISPGSLK